jgi:hypothetical protein
MGIPSQSQSVTVWFLEGVSDYSLLYIIQTSSGAYPLSISIDIMACFPGGKATSS